MSLTLKSEIFTRAVADITTPNELELLCKSGSPLRIKHGIDATSPYLHIGHAANLWKIRKLQEYGHKAVILFGDATTQIGDPTGKNKTRPILPKEEINSNIESIRSQVQSILINKPEVYEERRNSEWYGKMDSLEFLRLASMITHANLIERDMFQERIKKGAEITMAEILYPILQGYDSVVLEADMTIIGSDQVFNEHMGRFFQEKFGQSPQVIISLKLVPGLGGGEKMSKSIGNYIGVLDSPKDKFGKAMSMLDDLILPYLEIYTDVAEEEIIKIKNDLEQGSNPRDAKMFFAEKLVERYHGAEIAKQEKQNFISTFSNKEIPADLDVQNVSPGSWDAAELLVHTKLTSSKSEARRLLKQKAVEIDGRILQAGDKNIEIKSGSIIKVGKRKFLKIK